MLSLMVLSSPHCRWDKLKELMAKSPKHQYGRSSNAVATEADVPLRTLQDFIKSGGSPAKYNSEIQVNDYCITWNYVSG